MFPKLVIGACLLDSVAMITLLRIFGSVAKGLFVVLMSILWSGTAYAEKVIFFTQNTGSEYGAAFYNVEEGTWRWWFQDVTQARISPNGRKVAYQYFPGSGDRALIVADIEGPNPTVWLNWPSI